MGLLNRSNIFVRTRRSLRKRSQDGRNTVNDRCVHGWNTAGERWWKESPCQQLPPTVPLPLLHSVSTAAGFVGRQGTVGWPCYPCALRAVNDPLPVHLKSLHFGKRIHSDCGLQYDRLTIDIEKSREEIKIIRTLVVIKYMSKTLKNDKYIIIQLL